MVKISRAQSVGPSVCAYVRLSCALWKNGGSDPDAVWHHRSDRSRDEAGSGVCGKVHGKGYFWDAPLYPKGNLRHTSDSASTVRGAVWGGACGGPRHCCITRGST